MPKYCANSAACFIAVFFLLLDITNNTIKMLRHTQKFINFHPEMFHEISMAHIPFSDCEKAVYPDWFFNYSIIRGTYCLEIDHHLNNGT
jgi:hypothetical protein